ncbi:MAG: CCA tRNA nucleotidyltransferase [Spirochaetota bacterium]|nr:CCA tRNA nucleotidyltransferase [Spirochaetota bacterium]
MSSPLERTAFDIVKTLKNHGYKAYYAGGFVRDRVLGRPINDIDIATSAKPSEIKKLFRRTVAVGEQFGVIVVLSGGMSFEVATFRKDGSYSDGRHPDEVSFCDDKEDVLRRDFTINGMLYDPFEEEVIDYVGGRDDLKNRVIRAIGNPRDRFAEDKLRMIRAIRFAARFGFSIEQETWSGIRHFHEEIRVVSAERIRDELMKILTEGEARMGLELLDSSGLLKEILPEVSRLKGLQQPEEFHPEGDVFVHTMLLLENMRNPRKELAFAALLHDVGKALTYSKTDRIRFHDHDKQGAMLTKDICSRLKLSNRETHDVVDLVAQHMRFMNVRDMRESKLKRFLRQDNFTDHLELHRLDCVASHGKLDHYQFCRDKLKEYESQPEEALRPPRLIHGEALIELGFRPGPLFKTILEEVENAQLEGILQSREDAINYILSKYSPD